MIIDSFEIPHLLSFNEFFCVRNIMYSIILVVKHRRIQLERTHEGREMTSLSKDRGESGRQSNSMAL